MTFHLWLESINQSKPFLFKHLNAFLGQTQITDLFCLSSYSALAVLISLPPSVYLLSFCHSCSTSLLISSPGPFLISPLSWYLSLLFIAGFFCYSAHAPYPVLLVPYLQVFHYLHHQSIYLSAASKHFWFCFNLTIHCKTLF